MYSADERSETVKVGEEEFRLVLTVKAVKQIMERYGSMESMAEQLSSTEDSAQLIGEVTWLLTLLINQGIAIDNYTGLTEYRHELLTAEDVEMLMTPSELLACNEALAGAIRKGAAMNVASGMQGKKAPAGNPARP